MDDNYFAKYLANQADYQVRLTRSSQLRLVKQVADAQPKHQNTLPLRRWMSDALIAAGERMQQKITMEPTHTESIRKTTS
jgi:hypothetical protein